MVRKTTPSFVTEIELSVSAHDERELRIRFEVARQVYNAALGESLRRLAAMRQSRNFQVALKISKKDPGRNKLLKTAREAHSFREYDLHAYVVQFKHSWLGLHLDSNTIQKIATRAFRAVLLYSFGKLGRPRFKGKSRLKAVEGKTNKSGILLRDDRIKWLGLELGLKIQPDDEVVQHGLAARIKYVRIVHRTIRGRERWYAQLVCEGLPFKKRRNVSQPGVVGLDIGPATIAFYSEQQAALRVFCAEIADVSQEIARLQRQVERQRRAGNSDNYKPDRWLKNANGNWKHKHGKIKKGRQSWQRSTRMQNNQAKLAELHRMLPAHRKSLHGKLVNEILALGTTIKTEKVSYKAWQRMWGKSVGKRAPGMFVEHLRRKVENAGGGMQDINTRTTRLSQTCHACGVVAKKALSERWHVCACGVIAQRDLYSAFLAHCVENDRLITTQFTQYRPVTNVLGREANWVGIRPDPVRSGLGDWVASQANATWQRADSLLQAAVRRIETREPLALSASFGLGRRLNESLANVLANIDKAQDVVPPSNGRESLGELFVQ